MSSGIFINGQPAVTISPTHHLILPFAGSRALKCLSGMTLLLFALTLCDETHSIERNEARGLNTKVGGHLRKKTPFKTDIERDLFLFGLPWMCRTCGSFSIMLFT